MPKQLKARASIFILWRLGGMQFLHCYKEFTSKINQNMNNSNSRVILRGIIALWISHVNLIPTVLSHVEEILNKELTTYTVLNKAGFLMGLLLYYLP